MTDTPTVPLSDTLLNAVAQRALAAGVFASVRSEGGTLRCEARGSSEPAFYSLFAESSRVWVALQTPARYLSQSIEADLMFTGDKLPDLGYADAVPGAPELVVEHFRSEPPAKLYTFRSPLPLPEKEWGSAGAAHVCAIVLLGYEAAFRELGGMKGGD